jgi:hypothetical protein
VTITLPWGSLLRGVVGQDRPVAAGLARIARPGADIVALLAPADRDAPAASVSLASAADRATIVAAWETAGAELVSLRPATPEEIAATGSTWTKRLGLTRPEGPTTADRSTWRLELRRHERRSG